MSLSLRDDPVWQDVQPIAQDDGPTPVVPINYAPEYVELMDYFRAIVAKDERSERALDLTTKLILENPANYTAWNFRRQCLFALDKDLNAELRFCASIAEDGAKNYQLWFHRRLIVERSNRPGDELAHAEKLLATDSKNYHVWAHRQWVIERFGLWDDELAFLDALLATDPRNNSAWNQRFFVITKAGKKDYTDTELTAEIEFSTSKLDLALNNESPWNYLRGLARQPAFSEAHEAAVRAFIAKARDTDAECIHAPSLEIDFACRSDDSTERARGAELCQELAKLDPIRAKYWSHLASTLQTPSSSAAPS